MLQVHVDLLVTVVTENMIHSVTLIKFDSSQIADHFYLPTSYT